MIRILGVKITDAHAGTMLFMPYGWVERFLYFQRLINRLNSIEGDIVECGVARGMSLAMIASLVKHSGIKRHIWGYDSWEGFPELSKEDLNSLESIADKVSYRQVIQEDVKITFKAFGFPDYETNQMVTLVKGWFSDTLPKYEGDNIALLHIDADLYQSYWDCLKYLWGKVVPSGIVALDEYQLPDLWPGAKRAVDEFISQLTPSSAELKKDEICERYYIIKRKQIAFKG